jgi:hypothetical protein
MADVWFFPRKINYRAKIADIEGTGERQKLQGEKTPASTRPLFSL